MAITYFGVKISDNWIEKPDGSLVFKNAVIARTGFQKYKGFELPQRKHDTPEDEVTAQDLGIEENDDVNVYRSPEEVFSKRTIGTFEGAPVTDGHPDELLNIETIADHQCGHAQNVREGKEPLDGGDFPLLADLVVTGKDLIEKIKAGLRELSCGYNYHLLKRGEAILQVDIVGNHVAVVPNGRAGKEAAIVDALPIELKQEKLTMSDLLKRIRGLGFQVWAKDAKPEEVADAVDAISKADAKDADAHVSGCKCADCKGGKDAKPEAEDAKAKDRKRFHDALDKLMDSRQAEEAEIAEAEDADMEELKSLFGEKNKASDADVDDDFNGLVEKLEKQGHSKEGSKKIAGKVAEEKGDDAAPDDDDEDDDEDDSEANDEAVQSQSVPVLQPGERQENPEPSAVDAAYVAGQKAALKAFKPFVAASKDKRLKAAFDTATKLTKAAKTSGGGSYVKVAVAAGARGKSAMDAAGDPEKKREEALNAAFKAAHRKAYKQE